MVDYANANARHQQLFWPKNFKPEDAKAPSSTTYTSAPILAIGKRRKTAADVLRQLESNGTDDEEDIQVSDRSDDSLGAIGGRSSKKPAGVVTQSSKHQTSKLVQQKKNNISSKRPLDTSYGSGTGYTRSQWVRRSIVSAHFSFNFVLSLALDLQSQYRSDKSQLRTSKLETYRPLKKVKRKPEMLI